MPSPGSPAWTMSTPAPNETLAQANDVLEITSGKARKQRHCLQHLRVEFELGVVLRRAGLCRGPIDLVNEREHKSGHEHPSGLGHEMTQCVLPTCGSRVAARPPLPDRSEQIVSGTLRGCSNVYGGGSTGSSRIGRGARTRAI